MNRVPDDSTHPSVGSTAHSVSTRLAATTHLLAAPHGYTLSITGAFTMTAAWRGFPSPLAAYLFVVGATVGVGAFVLAGRACRPEDGDLPKPPALNPAAVVAGPAAAGSAVLIPPGWLAFLVAGAIASAGYVVLLSLMSGGRR